MFIRSCIFLSRSVVFLFKLGGVLSLDLVVHGAIELELIETRPLLLLQSSRNVLPKQVSEKFRDKEREHYAISRKPNLHAHLAVRGRLDHAGSDGNVNVNDERDNTTTAATHK